MLNPVNSTHRNLANCNAGEYYTGNGCRTCQEGYYCPGGVDSAATYHACAAGKYSTTGQNAASDCVSCNKAAGQVCPTLRASDVYTCQAGFKAEDAYCRPCAEGSYCPNGYTETSCTAGTNYSPGGLSACLSCPANKECHIYTYIDCTEGFYYESGSCVVCPAGHYCSNNVKTRCSAGEYQPFVGFTFCFQCPVNAKCPTTALTAYTDCTRNTEWSVPGSTACTTCALDHECFIGYSVPCPSNYYSAAGDYECHKCPEGKSCTNAADRTSQVTCSAGYYSPAGLTTCNA